MKTPFIVPFAPVQRCTFTSLVAAVGFVSMLLMPELAFAQFGGESGKACTFLSSVRELLNMASIAIVTVAIVFAGYQIAFAHKRIADVAPILIGGLLIGAAGQLAKWIMPDNTKDCAEVSTATLIDVVHGVGGHLSHLSGYLA